ncbi:MAG: ABC transporter substrate-binding protein [Defluviitaleaceae bacterium]|nr:ABC transporter substrate-binding protein [Defluviitaleaceae bacterium]
MKLFLKNTQKYHLRNPLASNVIKYSKSIVSTSIFFASTLFLYSCGNESYTSEVSETQTPVYGEAESSENIIEAETINYGGELIFLQASSPASLDPHRQNDGASAQVNRSIYEGLTAFDENGNLIPLLAESFEPIDSYTWQFNLRRDVLFHDGTPFNASAVQMSLERLLDPENAFPAAFILDSISEVLVIDGYTVNIVTHFPFAPLPSHLASMVGLIIAPSAIEEELSGGVSIIENPIGTGPFAFNYRIYGDSINLITFEDYWRGRPYIDSLTFLVIPEPSTRLLMVETGEAHAATAQASDVPNIIASPTLEMIQTQGSNITFIGFNTQIAPFNDVRVRQAISMVIDRESMVLAIIEGQGIPAVGPLSPLVAGATTDLETLGNDFEEALSLLEEAGFPEGFSANIYVSNLEHGRIAELAQANLAPLGINLNITQLEFGAFLEYLNNGAQEMFVLGWTAMTGDADYGLFPIFHSSMHGAPGNRTFFSNTAVDELLERARVSSDQVYRNYLYAQAQQILVNEAPMVFLYHPITTVAMNGVDGVISNPNIVPQFYRAILR